LYLSPEMVRRIDVSHSRLPSHPSDIWASGVAMYIMLMGYQPFSTTKDKLFNDIVLGNFTYIPTHWKKISPEALDLVNINYKCYY